MIEASQLLLHDETPRALGRLTLAGTLKNSRGVRQMRALGQRALVILVAGEGRYRDANGLRCNMAAGDALLIFPALPHRYGPGAGQSWDEIYLCFDGPIFDVWEREGMWDAARPLARIESGEIASKVARLRALCEQQRPGGAAENWQQLETLLNLLIEIFPPRARDVQAVWLRDARALLATDLGEALEMPSVARQVGRGYAAFRRDFAALTGVSPLQYRARKRIEAAQTLLERGEMTSAAIARNLGYNDEAHFSKAFKKATGLSPRAWKQSRKVER